MSNAVDRLAAALAGRYTIERELSRGQCHLGCVVYEMLVGRPPFTEETAQEILAHHALDPVPSLRKLRPDTPAGADLAIQRALAKKPRSGLRRWPSSPRRWWRSRA